jgi:hypothetical protein
MNMSSLQNDSLCLNSRFLAPIIVYMLVDTKSVISLVEL